METRERLYQEPTESGGRANKRPAGFSAAAWRVAREPFAQFALVAVAVFATHRIMSPEAFEIRVTAEDIQALARAQEDVLGRSVSDTERDQLIRSYVDQEILLHEAIAHGLDRTDAKVRQRLAGKMLFLLEDEPPEPTDEFLQAFYESHRDLYLTQPSVTFEHAFFKAVPADPTAVVETLESGIPPAQVGEPFWMGDTLTRLTLPEMTAVFGGDFATALMQSETRAWRGPLHSGRGVHFVRVLDFHAPTPLPSDVVQKRLREDWAHAWRTQARERNLSALRGKYQVVIDREEDAS